MLHAFFLMPFETIMLIRTSADEWEVNRPEIRQDQLKLEYSLQYLHALCVQGMATHGPMSAGKVLGCSSCTRYLP